MMIAAIGLSGVAACGEQKGTEPAHASVQHTAPPPAPETAPGIVNVPPADVGRKLAEKWQAIEDEKSILTVTAEGAWTNEYTGDATVHDIAKWRAFPGAEAPKEMADYTFTPTSTYIEVASANGNFYYELGGVDADTFDMFYVGRGNRLAYQRMK